MCKRVWREESDGAVVRSPREKYGEGERKRECCGRRVCECARVAIFLRMYLSNKCFFTMPMRTISQCGIDIFIVNWFNAV